MIPWGNDARRMAAETADQSGEKLAFHGFVSCGLLLLFWGGGCAPVEQTRGAEAPSMPRDNAELDRAIAGYAAADRTYPARGPQAGVLSRGSAGSPGSGEATRPDSRFEVTRIVAPEPPPPHAGSRRRIDVKLRRADLQEALRFLAHAGGFNLVIGEGVSGEVTAELRRVTPYDALQVIARAHGARVVHTRPSGGSSIVLVEPDR